MAAAVSSLSLPEINQAIRTEVATRPDDARRWLASLPFLNVHETGRLIFSSLKDLNRLPLDDDQRLSLMELYRKPVMTISRELQKNYLGMSVPIPPKTRPIAEQVKQFQLEMAHGYLRVAQHNAQKPRVSRSDLNAAALSIQRGIRYLTELLARSYEVYAPCPEGSWREIHQLYRYAEQLGITVTGVPDPLNGTIKQSSIAHVYKQALLLAFCNPYRLPPGMLSKIHRYLDRWASYAKIEAPTQALQHSCQFLINLQEDRPGISETEGVVLSPDAPYRLLTTQELTRLMHTQYMVLRGGKLPELDGLDKDFYNGDSKEMLRCLIDAWAIKPKRVFARVMRHTGQFELTVGIDNINFYTNGGQDFLPSSTEVGPPRRNARLHHRPALQNTSGHPRELSTWRLVDESAGGIALRKLAIGTDQIRVGELVALRQSGRGYKAKWYLGAVRWIKNTDENEIEMGVQRMSPNAAPRAIRIDTMSNLGKILIAALYLPPNPHLNHGESIIVRRGTYRPDLVMTLDDGYREQRIVAGRLLQTHRSFEHFEFLPQTV